MLLKCYCCAPLECAVIIGGLAPVSSKEGNDVSQVERFSPFEGSDTLLIRIFLQFLHGSELLAGDNRSM